MAKSHSTKTKSLLLLGLVIIILVAITAFMTFKFLNSKRVEVYYFVNNYDAGEQVDGSMFEKQIIAQDTYNAMAKSGGAMYVTAEEINAYIKAGDKLATNVVKGLPATDNLFVATGGSGVESRLSKGMVGVEVLASRVYGLTGEEVGVGSKVNVTTNFAYDNIKESDLIFQNVTVLDTVHDEDGLLSAVYLELSPEDALKLQHSLVSETVSISVLKPGDYTPIEGTKTMYKKVYAEPENEIDEKGFVEGMNGLLDEGDAE